MNDSENSILTAANQCVKCGACMPHCPTYQTTLDENESPRGRIALIQGLVKHDLPLSEKLNQHLDHCLNCMACEAACPSHVQYGKLLDDTKTLIRTQQSALSQQSSAWLLALLSSRHFNFILHIFLFCYQKIGLQKLLRQSGILRLLKLNHLEAILPPLQTPTIFKSFYAAKGIARGNVGLFLGCLNPAFDTQTVQDAIFVLTTLGWNVEIPKTQTCCGAMHLHSGYQKEAEAKQQKNQRAFSKALTAVVMLNSGCAATLPKNHIPLYQELCDFINDNLQTNNLQKSTDTIFVHVPCTQRNVLKQKEAAFTLLEKIPGIQLQPFSTETHCCGAAGTYMIRHAQTAKQLFLDLWEKRSQDPIQIIASNNIGCTLHFLAQFQDLKQTIKVVHPVSLIRQQLLLAMSLTPTAQLRDVGR